MSKNKFVIVKGGFEKLDFVCILDKICPATVVGTRTS